MVGCDVVTARVTAAEIQHVLLKVSERCHGLSPQSEENGHDANQSPEYELAFLEIVDPLRLGVGQLKGCVDDRGLCAVFVDVHLLGAIGSAEARACTNYRAWPTVGSAGRRTVTI